jgi:hypothetical protein
MIRKARLSVRLSVCVIAETAEIIYMKFVIVNLRETLSVSLNFDLYRSYIIQPILYRKL